MAQFQATMKGVEVNGETILSVIAGCTVKSKAESVLLSHGIAQPQPGKWYSQQAWLDSFKEIAETIGPHTLFSIGKKIPENAQFPPEINNIEKALQSINVAYHMNHRVAGKPLFDARTGTMQEGIGHYHFEKMEEKKVRMVCANPYPCEFDKGIIEAMAKKFKPKGSLFVKVTHDDSSPCRKKGADSCTYIVAW